MTDTTEIQVGDEFERGVVVGIADSGYYVAPRYGFVGAFVPSEAPNLRYVRFVPKEK